jgi:hypothetical protein
MNESRTTLFEVLSALILIVMVAIVGVKYGGPLLAWVSTPAQTTVQPAQAAPLAPRVVAPVQPVRSFAVPQAAPQSAPHAPQAPVEQPAEAQQFASEAAPALQVQREILSIQQQPADGSSPPVEVRRVIITTTNNASDETIVSDRGSKRKSGRP